MSHIHDYCHTEVPMAVDLGGLCGLERLLTEWQNGHIYLIRSADKSPACCSQRYEHR